MKRKMKLSVARKILWGLTVLAVAAVIGYGLSLQELWRTVFAAAALLLVAVYIGIKLLFWRCPHCGKQLGKLRLGRKYCYYCDKNVEDI